MKNRYDFIDYFFVATKKSSSPSSLSSYFILNKKWFASWEYENSSCERYGEHFFRRILTDREVRYCFQKANPYESIAVRFAAKEAFAKAVGAGISTKVHWHDVEVERESSGKPLLKLNREIEGVQSEKISLSLSHTHEYAVAIVVIMS